MLLILMRVSFDIGMLAFFVVGCEDPRIYVIGSFIMLVLYVIYWFY